jgi:hypothetical protein
MTAYDLTDVARLRLEDIPFFAFLLIVAAFTVRLLWNIIAKDFPRFPRLTFLKALCLTGILSLFMLLILIMISGAREILTPGAWHRQSSHYRPNDVGSDEERQQDFESLRSALMQFAQNHDGHFPPHDYVADIPSRVWEAPDSTGTRYVYIGRLKLGQTNTVIAFEPRNFGEPRFVLFADGKVQRLSTAEIQRLIGTEEGH